MSAERDTRSSRKGLGAAMALAVAFAASGAAQAADVNLFEGAINLDGIVHPLGAMPASVNTSAFDATTGLGQITVSVTGAGAHNVLGFFDHEIDETVNTFFNEYGAMVGVPAAGQSWEIDEPGFVFGDIYTHLMAGALDNTNGVPNTSPDDVSMALGWSFSLAADETATLRFKVGTQEPAGGFYLSQTDPDSQASIYLTSTLNIFQGGPDIPEPASVALVLLGLGALARQGWSKGVR